MLKSRKPGANVPRVLFPRRLIFPILPESVHFEKLLLRLRPVMTCGRWEELPPSKTKESVVVAGPLQPTGPWNAKPEATKFRLLYALNDGVSWKAVHPETPFVTGLSYDWTVPTPSKTKKNCLIKVIAYTEEGTKVGADSSDKPFSITVP